MRRSEVFCAALTVSFCWGLSAHAQAPREPYRHLVSTLSVGQGLRFNNPYRLSTQLGESESLSASAPYVDFGVGGLLGAPDGLQNGALLRFSVAATGIPQEVLTPNYLALYRFRGGLMAFARVGLPVVIRPDANLGGELGSGAAFLVQAGWGFNAELSYSRFLGAATRERNASAIGLLAVQAGLWLDYEVLP